jgi:hypothetical protein
MNFMISVTFDKDQLIHFFRIIDHYQWELGPISNHQETLKDFSQDRSLNLQIMKAAFNCATQLNIFLILVRKNFKILQKTVLVEILERRFIDKLINKNR